jgi:hypothetical protein
MRSKLIICVMIAVFFLSAKHASDDHKMFRFDESSKRFNENLLEHRTHRAGFLKMSMTNFGSIVSFIPFFNGFTGIARNFSDECTGEISIAAEMPAGSGDQYIFAASLWAGGYLDSVKVSINGAEAIVFQGPLVSTSMEGFSMSGNEMAPCSFETDPTGKLLGRIYESSLVEGKLNCLFEPVYDPKATAYEQFTTMYSDKSTDQYSYDFYDKRSHVPLGIEVRQVSYAWPYDFAKKFIIVDYTFYNRNKNKKDIYDFFAGVYVDDDIGNFSAGMMVHEDDICGFIDKWDGYIDPATGTKKTVDMNMVWGADNDGRELINLDSTAWNPIEPGAGEPLNGAPGVFTLRILRNPNPTLRYSFNIYNPDVTNESLDWGPRWKTGLHSGWEYDLNPAQKGYDDTNCDSIYSSYGTYAFGGRTEGLPLGDRGRYMVMSNDEFDYNQTFIRELYLGMNENSDGTPIPQAGKWQKWTTPDDMGGVGFAPDYFDGSIEDLNDIANGVDQRFVLGFGPLGYESYVNVATDLDNDGEIDGYIPNKKVWKFSYGDSLKLTLAFIVSENFHTKLEQDANYRDNTIVDLTDGLDISLFDQGWYDAYYNVMWAERVYDTPLFDTPVTRGGETKKDGWFGEDVGRDGLFGDLVGDAYCWWFDAAYPGPDHGEGDFEMTTFTTPMTDIDGFTSTNEDNLLPFGRKEFSDAATGRRVIPQTAKATAIWLSMTNLTAFFLREHG